MAKNNQDKIEDNCCSCGCEQSSPNRTLVEYLYLDLESCDRCIETSQVLEEVLQTLSPVLQLTGHEVDYQKIKIETEELAKQYHFYSSPTIRVNGHDIFTVIKENSCNCCSEISGSEVNCRVFEYNEESFEVPPKEMLLESFLKGVFSETNDTCSRPEYQLPDNLKTFFAGK
jgi:glutaredoxin